MQQFRFRGKYGGTSKLPRDSLVTLLLSSKINRFDFENTSTLFRKKTFRQLLQEYCIYKLNEFNFAVATASKLLHSRNTFVASISGQILQRIVVPIFCAGTTLNECKVSAFMLCVRLLQNASYID